MLKKLFLNIICYNGVLTFYAVNELNVQYERLDFWLDLVPTFAGAGKIQNKKEGEKVPHWGFIEFWPISPPLTSTIQYISPKGSKSLRKIKNIFLRLYLRINLCVRTCLKSANGFDISAHKGSIGTVLLLPWVFIQLLTCEDQTYFSQLLKSNPSFPTFLFF